MRATLIYGAGDIRVENVPDPIIKETTDALVRITTACICGSDLHPYASMPAGDSPARMTHLAIWEAPEPGSDLQESTWGEHVTELEASE